MAHDPLGRDRCQVLIGLMDPLATALAQGEGDGVCEVGRISGCELLVSVGHADRIADTWGTDQEQRRRLSELS
jgi:hypothetical protein